MKWIRNIICWIIMILTLYCVSAYLTLYQFMAYIAFGIIFSCICFTLAYKKRHKNLVGKPIWEQVMIFLILSYTYLPFTIIVLVSTILSKLFLNTDES